MDKIQLGIITLIKSAITQQAYELPDGFDIGEAYALVSKHHVYSMVYDGAVRCGISQTHPTMQLLFQKYCRALQINEGQMRELKRIFSAFEENQIDYMPLKGTIMKSYYPKPELRQMGDADILIRQEQYDRIAAIMEELGFEEKAETDQDYTWQSNFLYVELHKNLMPPEAKNLYAYFGNGWPRAEHELNTRYAMKPEDFFIFLLAHFAKHYRKSGIGCRHVVDVWVFRKLNLIKDYAYLEKELAKLQMLEFYHGICRLVSCWFEGGKMDDKMVFVTDVIFHSGSWGTDEQMRISAVVRETRRYSGKFGKILYLARRVFPEYKDLRAEWPILKKAPWLTPFIWFFRLLKKLCHPNTSLADQKKLTSMMTKDNLEARRNALNYIGLEYDD